MFQIFVYSFVCFGKRISLGRNPIGQILRGLFAYGKLGLAYRVTALLPSLRDLSEPCCCFANPLLLVATVNF